MIFYSSTLSDIERSTFTTDEKAYYGLDVTAPVVTLIGSGTQTIAHGSVFSDSGATWSDAIDGTGTIATANSGSVNTALTGSYVLTYSKVDAAGNTGSTTRIVVVADQTAPVMTLIGSGTITLTNGAVYTESGATWSDAVDGTGAIAAASSGSVNTTTAGTYTLTYRKVDAAGNTGSTIRTVTVLAPVVSSGNSGGGSTYSAPVKIVAPSTTQSGSVVASPIVTASNPAITQDHFDKKAADLKKSKTLTTTTTLKKGTQVIVYRVLPSGKQVKVGTVRVFNGKITYIAKTPGKYILTQK